MKENLLGDRYQPLEKLGQNASRQTWLALDLKTNPPEQVVIKLLAMTPEMEWDEYKLFEREAQVLKMLAHPRIPKYRDYFNLDRLADSRFAWFALVETYIPGTSLQQLLDQGEHFSEKQIEKIAIEVLTILIYLHELDSPVLHRDIKPSNLIWGEDERVYLVDFGSIQDKAAAEGATFTAVGTYGYVPMEQFGGRTVPASDLYALGATLIHLITGIAPFNLPQKNGRIQFSDRISLDPGLKNWISKLSEPNVADRFPNALQALKALENKQTLTPPILNRQPTGSRIRLQKSAQQLKIKIPSRGFKSLSLAYIVGPFATGVSGKEKKSVAFLLFALWLGVGILITFGPKLLNIITFIDFAPGFWMAIAKWFWLSSLFVLIPSCFLGGIIYLAYLLLPVVQQTDISFNREYFEIQWKIFGICYQRKREKIATLNSDMSNIYTDKSSGNQGLTIQIDTKVYTTNAISIVERHWVLEEIYDWLDLTIKSRV